MSELVDRGIHLADLGENPGHAQPQLVVTNGVLGSREHGQRPLSFAASVGSPPEVGVDYAEVPVESGVIGLAGRFPFQKYPGRV